ncbi:cytochrome ubiquinol oxidase subunit II [Aureimonas endophytica]|uniref:Ubiquinol oxidase subunit 2 n=1 Tax=Aureimonas endophytica TaxID=2027858 RepID=A0A917E399_9HYPH|nr:ubiquinol oxidase subunit II [Aureimonas endophytica]GGD99396.1 cytochrome ubiquinol oxidase subunit II [Aureimonas endophytica]
MTVSHGSRARRLLTLLGIGAAVLPLSSCMGILNPEGPVAEAQRRILDNATWIMVVAVLIPVMFIVVFFSWWYRASNTKATYRPNWAYSGAVELVVWAIPVLIILFLGGITWIGSHELDPRRPLDDGREPLDVQVVSLDWKWLFIYPSLNVASVNELAMPVGQPVRFHITSATVMNAFQIPQLGSMIYAMNGMETQLNLMANNVGEYHGQSSHYSGDGFSDMYFKARAMSAGDFSDWIGRARETGEVLDTAAYEKLVRESKDVKPYTYQAVQSGLFNSIVLQTAPQAPGPQKGEPSVDVSPRSEG